MVRPVVALAALALAATSVILFTVTRSSSANSVEPHRANARTHAQSDQRNVELEYPIERPGRQDAVAPVTGDVLSPAPESGLAVRRDIAPRALSNIKARQPTILDGLGYLTLEKEFEREASYAHHASQMAMVSIMVVYDAEGRSHTLHEGRAGISGSGIRPKDELRDLGVKFHKIHSGGYEYLVPHGAFPDYDRVNALIEQYPLGVPLAELPLEGIVQLCNTALSYKAK